MAYLMGNCGRSMRRTRSGMEAALTEAMEW
jgi:hypothetical protein